ncbi:MAG TPA: protein phosphatase 2C domain-containing protein [Planctomycetota bacterium]
MPDTRTAGRAKRGRDGGSEGLFHQIECHATSEMGAARPVNEDQYLLVPLTPSTPGAEPAYLFAVADGLGGAPAGDRASLIATRTLFKALREPWSDPGEALKAAVLRCQSEIDAHAERHPERHGMATTLTAALVLWPRVYIVHVGDSRCYALRPSGAERVTSDQTIAERMARIGVIRPEQVASSRWKNVLANVIGGSSPDVSPELYTTTLHWGDALLLATDGVTDVIKDEEILALTRERGSAETVCRRLIRTAQERGGKDDRTVVFARFGRSPAWRKLRDILLGP